MWPQANVNGPDMTGLAFAGASKRNSCFVNESVLTVWVGQLPAASFA